MARLLAIRSRYSLEPSQHSADHVLLRSDRPNKHKQKYKGHAWSSFNDPTVDAMLEARLGEAAILKRLLDGEHDPLSYIHYS